jgi:shikimate kinase/3-dehydroquinate synthase
VAPPALRILVGFMGAGKSSLAARLDPAHFLDSDAEFVARRDTSIEAFFAEYGEAAFRAEEERIVLELLDRESGVLALGGGAVTTARVREALAGREVIWLDVPEDVAWRRVEGTGRPLARDREAFSELFALRRPLYEEVADVVLPDIGDPLEALRWAERRPPGSHMEWAAHGRYPVVAAAGLLTSGWWPLPGRVFAVSDETVGPLHAGDRSPRFDVPPGEGAKTLASAERVWAWLAESEATRADHVAAIGGGVVGDLAGFCAATYQRGLPVVQVPTTLVAQVDSALGGKTGVDLPAAKNYVGAYHQPAAVLVDHATIDTLPAAEVAAGWAEVVKTALIAGGGLWERVRTGADLDPQTVLACARVKLRVVDEDERDAGRRQVLNLGHTVAHAIETVTGYGRYRHGEAVALGLLAALRLSDRADLRDEVEGLLASRGLPVKLEGADPAAVVAATRRDKKRVGEGGVPFVLLHSPGDVRPGCAVEPGALRAAVEELAA